VAADLSRRLDQAAAQLRGDRAVDSTAQARGGAAEPPHFHLGAGEFIVLSGELRYASGTARPGDYGYEATGAHHEKTHAVEETVIVYVGHGPLAMLDEAGRIRGATGSDGVNAFAMAHG
jgi:anti-sigma factor ChrR (cupin superfamily)